MRSVTVVLHRDPESGWWAEAPEVSGFSAAAASLDELRALVSDGLEFFLEGPVDIDERVAPGVVFPVKLSGFVSVFSSQGGALAHVLSDSSTVAASGHTVAPALR